MKTRKMISVGHHISLLSLACGLILIACNALTSYAQDENPQRGFYPGGSYSFSDIEKYNTVNATSSSTSRSARSRPGGRGFRQASI